MATTRSSKSRKSNHKKKAWKHIDLSEINQYLDDHELDERTGRVGADVFFINKEGDPDNIKKGKLDERPVDEEAKALINGTPARRSRRVSDAKAFRHLVSTSAVPAFTPDQRLNTKTTPLESIRQSKRLDKITKAREQSKQARSQVKKSKADANLKYDLWQEKEKTPIGDVYVDYAEDFEKVRLARINKCPRKQNPNVLKKPSLLPAVEQPHPGLSYNPNKDEHTDLLISIGDRKKKEIKEKKRLNKLAKEGFDPTVNVALEEAKEMASGLFSDDDEEDEESSQEDVEMNDDQPARPVVLSDLKQPKSSKAKRNALQERIDKLNSKRRKDKKRLETEFTRIKHYIKEAKAAEEATQSRMEVRERRKIERLYRPARLGREKYTDPEPEFCLEHELHGSLRKINTDGNLMMDRFKSLQRRNIIEHRRVLVKRRSRPARKHVIRSSIFNQDLFEKEHLEEDS